MCCSVDDFTVVIIIYLYIFSTCVEVEVDYYANCVGANCTMKLCDHRDRKASISYKSISLLPKEPELKELKLYVGMCHEFIV